MEEKRHAYLIMAHNQFELLEKLLCLLDDARNDIFLHIDKKVKNIDLTCFETRCSRARVFFPRKRIDVRWGTQSQVKTEMLLFKTAWERGPYHYYHLLSGVDLPLKSQNDIHSFFSEKQISFLSLAKQVTVYDRQRISRYHGLFPQWLLGGKLNTWAAILQEKFKVDRLAHTDISVRKGSNWGSLTQQAVDYLLKKEKQIIKLTRFSSCADEVYKQTILCNARFSVEPDNLRLTIWDDGSHPKILTMDDLPNLLRSDRLFARKFDLSVDSAVVDFLRKTIDASVDTGGQYSG